MNAPLTTSGQIVETWEPDAIRHTKGSVNDRESV